MKLALIGVGRMGKAVEAVAPSLGHQVVAWLDSKSHQGGRGMAAMLASEAVDAIDFSSASAVAQNVRAATGVGLDVVVGTTAWQDDLEEVRGIVERSERGLIHASNFSLGMYAFSRLVSEAASLVNDLTDYDVLVHEAHHRRKADHPSGTAIRLAQQLIEGIARKDGWSSALPDGPVAPETLQVSVSRGGHEPGTHSVILDGPDDRIELTHRARGRSGFARGALRAAEWVRGRSGLFSLDDMMADLAKPEGEGS